MFSLVGGAKRSVPTRSDRPHPETAWARREERLCPPYGPRASPSQREHIQHGRVADLLELRRVDELGARRRAQARGDGEILLAIDLESHRWGTVAGAEIDLPQFIERGVVIGRDGAVEQSEEDEAAG